MPVLAKKSEIIASFIRDLSSRGTSQNTLKNYRSDLGLFGHWFAKKLNESGINPDSFDELVPFISPSFASNFKSHLVQRSAPEKTVNRRLSALRALSRFLLESQIFEFDFMEGVSNVGGQNKASDYPTVSHFQKHLEGQSVSKSTIKNYVSDVKHFLNWLDAQKLPHDESRGTTHGE